MNAVKTPDADLDLAALELILSDQTPPFEGRLQESLGKAGWFDFASELFAAGMDYFGPVARKHARPLKGSSKADVADATNVIWLDFDPPVGTDLTHRSALIELAGRNLEGLKALGMAPSVFLFSGRGSWAYWKLDRHVSQAEAEVLMRRLYAVFRREGSEHDIGRIARMPGSVNAKTGLSAFVMEVSGLRWVPSQLAELLPVIDEGEAGLVEFDPDLRPTGLLPVLDLPFGLSNYVRERPPKAERKQRGIDGSGREQSIINRLVNAGRSDGEIAVYFDHHRLPRHEEEKRRRRGSYSWLARSVANARARPAGWDSPYPPTVREGNGTYLGQDDADEPQKKREIGWAGRLWWILAEMPEGLRKLELIEWVKDKHSVERSQARRDLDWLEEHGLIEQIRDEQDGRVRRVIRADQGRARLRDRKAFGPPLDFLKRVGVAKPQATIPMVADASEVTEVAEAEPVAEANARAARRAELDDELVRERAEIRRRQQRLINDVFRIHIPGDRWTYLQPLTPIEEWMKVRLHEQLPVGQDEIGWVYQSFVSPKDPAFGDESSHDPIEERTVRDGGWPARDKYVGLAAELAETENGFQVATREEQGVLIPNIGLVVQADSNFYKPLIRTKSLHDQIIAVRKRGSKLETTYEFMSAGERIVIEHPEFDLNAFLEALGDEAEMERVLQELPSGWYFVRTRV